MARRILHVNTAAIEDLTIRNIIDELQQNLLEYAELQGQYEVLHAVPDRPRQGLVVYADGTDWDPGSGEGLYRHNGSTWVFLG